MTPTFTLRLLGFPGMTPEQAAKTLDQQFRIPRNKAQMILSRLPADLKSGLNEDAIANSVARLQEAGGHVIVKNEVTGEIEEFQPTTPVSEEYCPNCRQKRFPGLESCTSCGIIFKKWNTYFEKAAKESNHFQK